MGNRAASKARSSGAAGIAARACNAQAVRVAHGSAEFGVDFHFNSREAMREQPRDPADRTGLALDV